MQSVLFQTRMLTLLYLAASVSWAISQRIVLPDESGPQCLPVDGVRTTCTSLHLCPVAVQGIKEGRYPKPCGFHGKRPDVCCPDASLSTTAAPPAALPAPEKCLECNRVLKPSPEIPDGRPSTGNSSGIGVQSVKTSFFQDTKADQMCKVYGEYVFKRIKSLWITLSGEREEDKISFCGRGVDPLIVGGEDARPREFPHMARIGYGEGPRIQWLCGGSLISERFILSAAHCAKISPHRLASWANLGDLDVSTEEDEAEPVTMRIVERILHPGYKRQELYHDIALFKLSRNAPLGVYIRPICLNTKRIPPQRRAIATGWGHTQYRGKGSSILQKVELDVVGGADCNGSYEHYIGKGRQLPRGILPDTMVCAGGQGAKDACQGDSGGPLQIPLDSPYCMYSIIGVTSFGRGCATSSPGVYTNVSNYLAWIESIVWPL